MRLLIKLLTILALIGAIYAIGTFGVREYETFEGGNEVHISI